MKTPTILCVDGERSTLLTLRCQLLQQFPDCNVEITESRVEALKLVQELVDKGTDVPLVIAGQPLPKPKEDPFLIELHRHHPQILKVMLTEGASPEEVWKVVNEGGLYRCLSKPWNEIDLLLTVSEAMRRYQQEQQIIQQQLALEQANQEIVKTQQREAFLQSVFDRVEMGIYVLEVLDDGDFLYVDNNPVATRMIGRDANFFRGRRFSKWAADISLPADVYQNMCDRYRHCVTTGEVIEFEETAVRNGKQEWWLSRVTPVNNPQGVVTQLLVTSFLITDRKQAEAALRQSEEKFRQMAESISDIFWMMDVEQEQVLYISPAFERVWGRPRDQLYQQWGAGLAFIHPEDQERVAQTSAQCLQSGGFELEYRILRPDGTVRYLLDRGFVIPNEAGRLTRAVGVAQDTTERKQTELALQQLNEELELRVQQRTQDLAASQAELQAKEQFLRGVFEGTENAVFVVDVLDNGRLEYTAWNQATEFLTGVSRTDALGKSPQEVFGKEIGDVMNHDYHRCRQTTEMIQHEACLALKSSPVWILTTLNPLKDANGRVYRIIGNSLDITARKKIEQALQESEARFQAFMDNSPAAFWITDRNGMMIYISQTYYQSFQFSATDAIGKSVFELYPSDIAQQFLDNIQTVANTNQVLQTVEIAPRSDGSLGEFLVYKFPISDASGQCLVGGVAVDISERKQLEQELRQINAELEQRVANRTQDIQRAMETAQAASQAKTIFLSNMSHELRTPLNAILGFSQLLNRSSNLTATQQEQIGIINRSGEHLLSLINDVLAMSKIESGRITLNITCFDIRELLRDLKNLFHLKAESKRLALITEISNDVPQLIKTDESKLRQILINLLGNAVKFTVQGHVVLRVWQESLCSKTHSNYTIEALPVHLHFEVEDTGCGIDPTEQDNVFEPFRQTQSGRNAQEGTGLGLSISRRFVQLMGGEMSFVSTPNQGSIFRFTILTDRIESTGNSAQNATARVVGLVDNQPKYRLLVVEDNPENRQYLVQLLCSVGFEVQTAVNGQEAIDCWQIWKPHLIWMDMRMPVMDGYTATQQIRTLEQQKGEDSRYLTKILALTASAFEDERAAILAAGCDDFLSKPTTEAALFEKIAQHLKVSYIYQGQTPAQFSTQAISDHGLIRQELQKMPPEWLSQLQLAARIADEDLILQGINQLPSDKAELANALKEFVEAFQFEQLIQLTTNQSDK